MELTVYLADDERIILRGLKKLIDWKGLGLTLVGEAYRGDELLQGIVDRSPDIVIADIAMPGMTGIEVLKRLEGIGRQTKIIFVSAYREFSYAQDALSYGAVDYLIKPIDRKKLEQILLRTATAIRETSKIEDHLNRLTQYEQKYQRQVYIDFLERLIEEKRLPGPPEVAAALRGDVPACRFSVIAVEFDHALNHTGSWHEGERKLLHFAIHNIVAELGSEHLSLWAVPVGQHLCLVVKHPLELNIHELCTVFHSSITRFLKVSVTLGLGSAGNLEQIPASYEEAVASVSYKFYMGTGRLISYTLTNSGALKPEHNREQTEKELLRAILFSEESVFRGLLDHWLETIRSLSWGNRNYTVALCTSLLTMAHREMPPSGTEKQFDDLQIVQLLHECETFAGLCRCIREQLGLLRMKIHGRSGTKEAVQIAQVKAYIDEHYAEEISLETMASRFYMNPSYFSTFFKKNTGLNFKQYVTDARMKAALHMLTQTDAMLYEIAEKIGYHHARQFSEMFKKQFGMLPGEYRKRAEGEREEAEA